MPRILSAGAGVALLGGALLTASPALAQTTMPSAEQNGLVKTHCAVCHNDKTPNGGLSLERFSVDSASPSLVAVLLSKLTQGLSVATLQASHTDASAKALVATRMKGGAINAAGVAPPPDATTYALIDALAARTRGVHDWSVGNEPNAAGVTVVTASILREVPRGGDGEAAMYRLIATCDGRSGRGEMRISWSPMPAEGTLLVVLDGRVRISRKVEGMEKMGNGLPGATPPASAVLSVVDASARDRTGMMALPLASLTIRGPLGDTVLFPFASLPAPARRELEACFRN